MICEYVFNQFVKIQKIVFYFFLKRSLFDKICRQRLEDMRRLYNADVSEAATPENPFANVNEMLAAMVTPAQVSNQLTVNDATNRLVKTLCV